MDLLICDGARYLVLFVPERYDSFDRIRNVISKKSVTAYIISHNFARIRIDSYKSLPIEKTLIFHNVIILIRIKIIITPIYF